LKTEPIHLQRGLTLYKQPLTSGGGSPFWYARVWMRIGNQTVHTRSTGTTDQAAAKRFAEDFFAECLFRRRYGDAMSSNQTGAPVHKHRFDKVADEWLGRKKVAAGNDPRRLRAFDDARKLMAAPNGLGAFFKRSDLGSITTDTIRQYLCFAAEHSKKGQLATTTQRNHVSVLNGILKFAAERRIITVPPPMPKLRLVDNPRPCFTAEEFSCLCAAAAIQSEKARLNGDHKVAQECEELGDFLIFMVATFLRAGEWKELRQRHCRIVDGDCPYLEVAVPNGKTHKRKVVSMPDAIAIFRLIVSREGHDPEAYLFKPQYRNRDTAQERIRDSFEALLAETQLAFDGLGNKRTIYSLRHTSLMFRLLHGDNVDLMMLARNAGTSVGQLDRFYLSHAHAAMKVENLHSMKQRREVPVEPTDEKPRGAIQLEASVNEPFVEAFA
jgi:hypothetical protein